MAVYFQDIAITTVKADSPAHATVYFKDIKITTINANSETHPMVYFKDTNKTTINANSETHPMVYFQDIKITESPTNISVYYIEFNIYRSAEFTGYTNSISDIVDKLNDIFVLYYLFL